MENTLLCLAKPLSYPPRITLRATYAFCQGNPQILLLPSPSPGAVSSMERQRAGFWAFLLNARWDTHIFLSPILGAVTVCRGAAWLHSSGQPSLKSTADLKWAVLFAFFLLSFLYSCISAFCMLAITRPCAFPSLNIPYSMHTIRAMHFSCS